MRRSSVLFPSRAALLALALVGSACDNGPEVTLPTPNPVTQEFTGSLTLNGATTHSFDALTAGGRFVVLVFGWCAGFHISDRLQVIHSDSNVTHRKKRNDRG